MPWILGRATEAEIDRMRARGYLVEVGALPGSDGLHGSLADRAGGQVLGEQDVRVYVECDLSALMDYYDAFSTDTLELP